MMETEVEIMHFEDGGRGHQQKNIGGLWKLEKVRKRFSSRVFQMEHQSANILILAQLNWF